MQQEDTFDALREVLDDLPGLVYDVVESGIEFRVEGALFGIVKDTKVSSD
ncbi:MAG: hypothetical protein H6765_08650 [Candidatus Peribacteria bacterium]|nr:MAG: hypothetical protein H6765_08650 [Candidatus Peribacteria bacterium]